MKKIGYDTAIRKIVEETSSMWNVPERDAPFRELQASLQETM